VMHRIGIIEIDILYVDRERNELVYHSAYSGKFHRHNVATSHIIYITVYGLAIYIVRLYQWRGKGSVTGLC
jgi:hypothetical protein